MENKFMAGENECNMKLFLIKVGSSAFSSQ